MHQMWKLVPRSKLQQNQTYAQYKYTQLIQLAAIRLQAERSIRRDSNVLYAVKRELELIRDKFRS